MLFCSDLCLFFYMCVYVFDRYKKVIEEHQNEMDVFKAVNIFRTHINSQKSLYKAV